MSDVDLKEFIASSKNSYMYAKKSSIYNLTQANADYSAYCSQVVLGTVWFETAETGLRTELKPRLSKLPNWFGTGFTRANVARFRRMKIASELYSSEADHPHTNISDLSMSLHHWAERYLNEPVTTHPDGSGPSSLAYWKSVQHVYPLLSKMAIDYLAIPGSSTPVERVWSSAADTDTKKRNRLSSDHLSALQLLKMVYRREREQKLSAEEMAKQREERLRIIEEADWACDLPDPKLLQFPEFLLDLLD